MAEQQEQKNLEPGEVVSATYYPNKRRLIVAGVSGAIFGLIAGVAFSLLTAPEEGDLIAAVGGPLVGAALALFHSVRNTSLRFGTNWVEGPLEGGTGTLTIRKGDVGKLEIPNQSRLRLVRGDGATMLVNLDHYDFMDQQMIRMRLTSLAGGPTSTPPETLVVESRRRRPGIDRKKGDVRQNEDA